MINDLFPSYFLLGGSEESTDALVTSQYEENTDDIQIRIPQVNQYNKFLVNGNFTIKSYFSKLIKIK